MNAGNTNKANTLRLVKQASEVLEYLGGLPPIKASNRPPPDKPQELSYINNNDEISMLSVHDELSPVHSSCRKTATQCFYNDPTQFM